MMMRPLVVFSLSLAFATGSSAQPLPRAFDKTVPESVQDLKAIQQQVRKILEQAMPATVGVRIGNSQGSGVLVSADGKILTAGHVSNQADQDVIITLHDGKQVKGKTLGANLAIDSGMIQITEKGPWPYVPMGASNRVRVGEWVLCLGHPLGQQHGRPPVVRLGRVLEAFPLYFRTDCPLVGGDSGGPLFDMHGQVVAINSRIGDLLSANIHVPTNNYKESWDRLAKAEVWGTSLFAKNNAAYLGARLNDSGKIVSIAAQSPAERMGLKIDDVVITVDGKKLFNDRDLHEFLFDKQPGTEIRVEVQRGASSWSLRITLDKKP